MLSQSDGLREERRIYDIPSKEYGDYDTGQETGAGQPQIFVDKSQHITNYTVNINVTGANAADFATAARLTTPTYVMESELSNKLTRVLDEIEDILGIPEAFEQKLSAFLSMLDKLYERRLEREVYFSDLLSLLHMGLVNIECGDLKRDGVAALRDAVSSLPHRITEERVRELRKAFRDSGIAALKPLTSHVDTASIMREIYGDETTT
jgi:hypothetical protein